MPGEGDPTNQALPQQPLHPCLFPEAKRFSPNTFASCTNPHDFTLGGVDFLGTAGQNVSNLAAYTDVTKNGTGSDASAAEALDLMEATVRWQHVAPTAPDTLACYPYKDRDPFFIEKSPHVYFAGMQPSFGWRKVNVGDVETVCVSVPDFSKTGAVVMLNVDTLECHPVTFGR
jgi:DNA polymerase delta subunit 2